MLVVPFQRRRRVEMMLRGARINAQWTSPGGIIIGANVEQNSRRRASEVLEAGEIYGFVASDYGRLEVGLQDGPADTLAFAAPLVALGQVRGEFSRYAGSQALLRALDTQDAFKVIYLSPPVAGFRGGVSYSPKVRRNAAAVDLRERIEVNDAFCALFAHPRAQVVGRTSLDLQMWVDPQTRGMLVQRLQLRCR